MAVYTIEYRKFLELYPNLTTTAFYLSLDWPVPSFLPEMPVYDPTSTTAKWLTALQNKITYHYKYNEICTGSFERFHDFFQDAINMNMPYFNKMYEALNNEWTFYTGTDLSETITDGRTIDYTRNNQTDETTKNTREESTSGSNSNTNTVSGYNLTVDSNTPGQMLNIETDIANNTYASAARKNKTNDLTTDIGNVNSSGNSTDDGTLNSTTNIKDNTTDNFTRKRTVEGLNDKSYVELFEKYSKLKLNIDEQVIKSFAPCFMGIF